MEYTYNKREELEIGVNTMITLERKLEQYTHTYSQLKGELKWKTSDSRTGMMIAAMMTTIAASSVATSSASSSS